MYTEQKKIGIPKLPTSLDQLSFHALLIGCKANSKVNDYLADNPSLAETIKELANRVLLSTNTHNHFDEKVHSAVILENYKGLKERKNRRYAGLGVQEISHVVEMVYQSPAAYTVLEGWQQLLFSETEEQEYAE